MAYQTIKTTTHPNFIEAIQTIRDVLDGEIKVKSKRQKYLPAPGGMSGLNDEAAYNAYLSRATLYELSRRTVYMLLGMATRTAPIIEVTGELEQIRDGVGFRGYTANELIRLILEESMTVGRCGVMVDIETDASSDSLPFDVFYKAEDIETIERDIVDGRLEITRVVLKEATDGEDHNEIGRTIELKLEDGVYMARKSAIRSSDEGDDVEVEGDFIAPTFRGSTIDFIPFQIINSDDLQPEITMPRFYGIVSQNIKHYQMDAELIHAARFAAFGTTYFAGATAENLQGVYTGPGANVPLPEGVVITHNKADRDGGDLFRDMQTDIEDRMAAMGAELIRGGGSAGETAEAVRIRLGTRASALTSIVANTERAIEQLFRMKARMLSVSEDDINVELSRDFIETRLSATELTSLVAAWQSGVFGSQAGDVASATLYQNLRQGEVVPQSVSEVEFRAALAQRASDDLIGEALSGGFNTPPAQPEEEDEATEDEEAA